MTRIDASGFGALNVDHVFLVDTLENGDDEVVSRHETLSPGGSAANTIFALGRLGLSTAFMGCVAGDAGGELLLQSFRDVRTDTSWIDVAQGFTGEALIFVDPSGRRRIVLRPGANDVVDNAHSDRWLSEHVPDCRLVHMTSFASSDQLAVQAGFAARLPPDTLLSVSPGALYARLGRHHHHVTSLLARADYVLFNQREITTLVGESDYVKASIKFARLFPRCRAVSVTLGRGREDSGPRAVPSNSDAPQLGLRGGAESSVSASGGKVASFVLERAKQNRYLGHRLYMNGDYYGEVGDTTGAGDAYAAGFLFGVLRRRPTVDSAMIGHVLSQFSVVEVGARSAIPTAEKLEQRLADYWDSEQRRWKLVRTEEIENCQPVMGAAVPAAAAL